MMSFQNLREQINAHFQVKSFPFLLYLYLTRNKSSIPIWISLHRLDLKTIIYELHLFHLLPI